MSRPRSGRIGYQLWMALPHSKQTARSSTRASRLQNYPSTTHTHMDTPTHTYIHTYIHTYTNSLSHTNTRTHTISLGAPVMDGLAAREADGAVVDARIRAVEQPRQRQRLPYVCECERECAYERERESARERERARERVCVCVRHGSTPCLGRGVWGVESVQKNNPASASACHTDQILIITAKINRHTCETRCVEGSGLTGSTV